MLKHFTRLKSIAYNDVEKYVENVETVENSKKNAPAAGKPFQSRQRYALPALKRLKFYDKH